MENYCQTQSRFLLKSQHFFRLINSFTKELTKEFISRKFFTWSRFIVLFHTGNYGNLLPCHGFFFLQKFRHINVSLNSFTINWFDAFDKKNCVAGNFSFFHTALCTEQKKKPRFQSLEEYFSSNQFTTKTMSQKFRQNN